MKNREEIQKELQELSPFLAKLKAQEQQPEVPENYFHTLPNQIWEQIKLEPASQRVAKQLSIWERFLTGLQILLQPRVAVSLATFAVLITASIFLLQPKMDAPMAISGDLTAEDITDYIQDNLHEFDTELLIQATANLPEDILLPNDEFSEEEIDKAMDEILDDLDERTLQEML